MKQLFLYGLLIFAIGMTTPAHAQKKKKKGKGGPPPATAMAKKPKGPKKVADAIKKLQAIEGLFTFYRDSTNGALKMVITEEQLNQEFIHWFYIENGALEAGANRGSFRGSKIFRIEKYYDKIEFVVANTTSYFDPENPLSKAANANISEGIVYSGKIMAGSAKEGKYLIDADKLFLSESFAPIDRTYFRRNPNSFKLGALSKTKSKYELIKSYPENSDVRVKYVYDNRKPRNGGSRAVTDARSVSITAQHSLIQMPDNDYEPRFDDPRVGYFTTQTNDMTTDDFIAYRDFVHRWNLKKKDPGAAMSEPVKPITWWIENTTPYEWRETIKEAVLEWNKPFEKAGFKNAVVVKVQPDDADWDAGDIRYNVLRWTSSPRPPFGGYGPSFVNPRTGEILGADIMLEYSYISRRGLSEKLYTASNSAIAEGETHEDEHPSHVGHHQCALSESMQLESFFGATALQVYGSEAQSLDGMLRESMKYLIMHEVGHTMGLNHNMKSSQLFSPAELYDPVTIQDKCLTGSIMDYPTINLSPNPSTQGHYFSTALGPYDEWAIEWGYSETDEDDLDKIAARSTDPTLIFGNDADDMRAPGKGIDPRVNVFDISNDVITYSIDRIKMSLELMPELQSKLAQEGDSYMELRTAFYTTHRQISGSANNIARYIGGVYVDRAMQGQDGATKPFSPVSYQDQKRAMNALGKYVFAPDAFAAPEGLFNYLAMQRRGFNLGRGTEDPKLHARVWSAQIGVLRHILHPNTLQRISDSELYGNKYKLSEFMTDLNDAIFKADAGRSVNTYRQNLQIEYTKMLLGVITDERRYDNLSKSMALYNIKKIDRIAASTAGNVSTRAHREHLKLLIETALDD